MGVPRTRPRTSLDSFAQPSGFAHMAQLMLRVSRMLGKALGILCLGILVGLLFAIQLGCSSQSKREPTFDGAPVDGAPFGKDQIGPGPEVSAEVAPELVLHPDLDIRKDTAAPDLLPDEPTGIDLLASSLDTGIDGPTAGDLPSPDGAAGSIGPIDGSWKLAGLSCNSSPDGAWLQRAMTLHGDSGAFFMTRGSCATTIAMAVAYPAAGTLVLTYGEVTCAPADCGCSTSEGRDSTGFPGAGTYVLKDGSLKITINDPSGKACPGGSQTSTWIVPS
jgi:hypothetical protein